MQKGNWRLHQNSAAIMLRHLLVLVVGITLLSGIATVFAVGQQLLQTSQENATAIVKSLKNTVIDDDPDWRNWRRNSTLDTSTSYVKVHNMRADAQTEYYYSPGTHVMLRRGPIAVPLIGGLYYARHAGFMYYKTGHAKGINYQLWLKLDDQLDTLGRVILVAILVLGFTLLLSPLFIRLLTKRLTEPLETLTHSTQAITSSDVTGTLALPVPQRPTEVTQLAVSFNQLLTQLKNQTDKEKSFIANAAHELRTPIATIRSHAQLIERRGEAHPEIIQESVHYINEESHQMQALIESLLLLSRADRGQADRQTYDLSQSLTRLVAKLTPLLQQKLVLTAPAAVQLTADPNSVEQIVTNLVNNAGKYAPANTTIQVVLTQQQGQTQLQVIDAGPGIAPAEQAHIFERFYRGAEVRGKIGGTGLGLAIVQQLAQLNQAKVTLTANQPHGCIFTVHFSA
jgi:signal transduction histidine kinase